MRILGLLICFLFFGSQNHAFAQSASIQQVRESAAALGGVGRIQSIANITLIGYGQWAYQYGGGNITADPNAPQKWVAANDLRRVYDLENDQFQSFERRNFLFPFAIGRGHAFNATNQVLDGAIAFNISEDGSATRIRRAEIL